MLWPWVCHHVERTVWVAVYGFFHAYFGSIMDGLSDY